MINILKEQRHIFQEQLQAEIKEYHYRFTRYHVNYAIVLLYISEENCDLSICGKHLRETDKILFFQPNFCAILLDQTNEEQGIKAANIILSRIQNIFFTKHLYMAVIAASNDRSQFQMVHDLFDLISYALNHKMENLVLESSQVIQNQQSL